VSTFAANILVGRLPKVMKIKNEITMEVSAMKIRTNIAGCCNR